MRALPSPLRSCLLAFVAAAALLASGTASAQAIRILQLPAGAMDKPPGVGQARDRGVTRARDVQPSFAALNGISAQLEMNGRPVTIVLDLFTDATFSVVLDRGERLNDGSHSLTGYLEGLPHSTVTLVHKEGILVGNINYLGKSYQIRTAGRSGHEAREIDQAQFVDHAPEQGPVHVPKAYKPADNLPMVQMDDGSQIDVIVLYTAAARAGAGSTAAMQAQVALGITETNAAYAASNVIQRLRLVYSGEVNYADSGNMQTDLVRLRDSGDGFLEMADPLRNLFGADFVSLWVENGGGGCGIAFFMSTVGNAFAPSAYNVTARSCATGNYSFGHELGHNMGLRHDVFVDSGLTPFAYAAGYVNKAQSFRTVMAYNDLCSQTAPANNCTRVQRFSTPLVNYNGFPQGTATADASLALNNTRTTTANFRAAVTGTGPGALQFSPLVYSALENVGSITLSVERIGGSTGAASVAFTTAAGTATAGSDYTHTTGTLTWNSGESGVKTFNVPILNDAPAEASETFTVTLSGASGASLLGGGTSTATVTVIDDNDVFPGCAIPTGWITPSGATTGWQVATDSVVEGTCALSSMPLGDAPNGQTVKAQIEFTGIFLAGNITFQRRVSSELNWDCLRVLLDAVAQNIGGTCTNTGGLGASGEVAYGAVSIPVAAGLRTINFSFERDNVDGGGQNKAWIDNVVLPLAPVSLTVANTGTGTGTVTSNPAGVTCPGTCSASFAFGASVTLTATPAGGSTFTGWSGSGCAGTGTCVVALTSAATVTATFAAAPPSGTKHSEFNGDGRSDVLWRNSSTGEVYQWQLNGLSITGQGFLPNVPAGWNIAAIGDFTADGRTDALWRNDFLGLVYLWTVNALSLVTQGYLPSVPAPWIVAGAGDLNGDGVADVVWRNPTTGENYVWIMGGGGFAITSQGFLPGVPGPDWEIVATGRFNDDTRDDILWRNKVTGQNYLWTMNGLAITSEGFMPPVSDANWEVVGAPDANNDGKADVLWRHKTSGDNYLWLMNGLALLGQGFLPNVGGAEWKVSGYGDYNGDGNGDVLWRNGLTGQMYLWTLNGMAVATQGFLPSVSGSAWTPVRK